MERGVKKDPEQFVSAGVVVVYARETVGVLRDTAARSLRQAQAVPKPGVSSTGRAEARPIKHWPRRSPAHQALVVPKPGVSSTGRAEARPIKHWSCRSPA